VAVRGESTLPAGCGSVSARHGGRNEASFALGLWAKQVQTSPLRVLKPKQASLPQTMQGWDRVGGESGTSVVFSFRDYPGSVALLDLSGWQSTARTKRRRIRYSFRCFQRVHRYPDRGLAGPVWPGAFGAPMGMDPHPDAGAALNALGQILRAKCRRGYQPRPEGQRRL
jgi:hypothetical protein